MLKKVVVGEEANGGWMWANCGVGSCRIWEECSHAVDVLRTSRLPVDQVRDYVYSPPKIAPLNCTVKIQQLVE